MTLRVPPVNSRSIRVPLVHVRRPIPGPRCSRIWPEGRWATEDCGYQASCSLFQRRVWTQTGGHAASSAARTGQWPSRRFDSVPPVFPDQRKAMLNGQRPMCRPEVACAVGASHGGCRMHEARTALPALLEMLPQLSEDLTPRRGSAHARALALNHRNWRPLGDRAQCGGDRVARPGRGPSANL